MKTLNSKSGNGMKAAAALFIIMISFSTISKGDNPGTEALENEPVPAIENWMTDNNYWTGTLISETNEQALEIESWMMSSAYWNGSTDVVMVTESSLPVESWMNSSAYWNGTEEQINFASQMADN